MHQFDIYYEPADSDEKRIWLGEISADTMGEALQKAAEYYEYASHDLVAIQTTPNALFPGKEKHS